MKWNAGSALKSHVSDFGDISITFLRRFCSGRRQSKREHDWLRRLRSSQHVWRFEFNNIDIGVGLCLFDCAEGEGRVMAENSWIGFLAETNQPKWFQIAPGSAQWVTVLMTSLDFMSRLETQTQPKRWEKKDISDVWIPSFTYGFKRYQSLAWTQPSWLNKLLPNFYCFNVIHVKKSIRH